MQDQTQNWNVDDKEWYDVWSYPVFQSAIRRRVNMDCFVKALKDAGLWTEDQVRLVRERHWACGLLEKLEVKRNTPAYELCRKLLDKLSDYPLLDENAYTEALWEEAADFWNSLSERQRLKWLEEFVSDLGAHGWKQIRRWVRGKEFPEELLDRIDAESWY